MSQLARPPPVPTCPLELDLGGFFELSSSSRLCYGKWTEYLVAACIACSLPALRFVLDRTLFHWLLSPFLRKDATKLAKAKESAWKFTVYCSLVALALAAALGEPWFRDTRQYWWPCSGVPCEAPILPKVRLLYCVEMGYYAQELPMLFLWATRRNDFAQLLAHHVATLGLIVYSLELGITRCGTVIYLLHDLNDPFLEVAKVFRYLGHQDASTLFFVAFVASWFASRVYYFPAVVIRSTLWEVKERALEVGVSIEPHYTILNALLLVLLALHVYWSYLIVRVIARQLSGRGVADVREDDDDKED